MNTDSAVRHQNGRPASRALVLSGGGANLMDAARAGEAYEAGVRQAKRELERVRAVSNG